MIVLGYIGDHKKDTLSVRLGWWLTRWAQSGAYKQVTHTESVLDGDSYKRCTIASSSARDGGVRQKQITPEFHLTKGHWKAINVPTWNESLAKQWFDEHEGLGYDWHGAVGSIVPFIHSKQNKWFCNEATGAPFIQTPEQYPPSKFWALALSMPNAHDITDKFFSD